MKLQKVLYYFILISLSSFAIAEDKPPVRNVEIVTNNERLYQFIHPVRIYRIDEQEINVPEYGYRIPAGRHQIRFKPLVRQDKLQGISRNTRSQKPLILDYDFKPNTRYFVGVKAKKRNPKDWEILIWKEEPYDG